MEEYKKITEYINNNIVETDNYNDCVKNLYKLSYYIDAIIHDNESYPMDSLIKIVKENI
ncbi:MAG: hypothetical protein PUD59_05825 [bacterium]|nr:hypothetical protein [bacterium]